MLYMYYALYWQHCWSLIGPLVWPLVPAPACGAPALHLIIAAHVSSPVFAVGPGLASGLGIRYHFWAVCLGCPTCNHTRTFRSNKDWVNFSSIHCTDHDSINWVIRNQLPIESLIGHVSNMETYRLAKTFFRFEQQIDKICSKSGSQF